MKHNPVVFVESGGTSFSGFVYFPLPDDSDFQASGGFRHFYKLHGKSNFTFDFNVFPPRFPIRTYDYPLQTSGGLFQIT